jgi:hypothetical protein
MGTELIGPVVERSLVAIADQPSLLRRLGSTAFQFAKGGLGTVFKVVSAGATVAGLYEVVHSFFTGKDPTPADVQAISTQLKKMGIDPDASLSTLTADALQKLVRDAAPTGSSASDVQDMLDLLTHSSAVREATETPFESLDAARILEEEREAEQLIREAARSSGLDPVTFATLYRFHEESKRFHKVIMTAAFDRIRRRG